MESWHGLDSLTRLWTNFRRKFWIAIYRWAGRHVGPEAIEYWDQHWWLLVKFRLWELGQSDLGMNTMYLLLYDNVFRESEMLREQRDARGVRDRR